MSSDYRTRHFMQDLRNIMPHTKADVKLEKKNDRVKYPKKLINSTDTLGDDKRNRGNEKLLESTVL
jgi:hypothetical protein